MSKEGNYLESAISSEQMRLVSATAHDLKTPLSLIKGIAQILRTDKLTDSERNDFLSQIEASSQRMLELIEGLISTTSIADNQTQLDLEPVDVSSVVDSLAYELKRYADMHNKQLVFRHSKKLPLAITNRHALSRVFYNLADNAIKHSNVGEKIIISVRKNKDTVMLSVRDYGIGVRKSDLDRVIKGIGRISEPNPAHAGSSGLGLYIASQLAQATNAVLGVKTLSEGTSFYLKIPIATQLSLF